MRLTITCLLFVTAFFSFSQEEDSVAMSYANTITPGELREHLEIIASDEYAGRETGKEGQKKTEAYLVKQFKELGLSPGNKDSYVQYFDVVSYKPSGDLSINGKKHNFFSGFYFYDKYTNDLSSDEVVFAGYGIETEDYSDYTDLDVKGKVVVILEDEPYDKHGKSLISGDKEPSNWSYSWRKKYKLAKEKGAVALFTIINDFENKKKLVQYYLNSSRMVLAEDAEEDENTDPPSVYISKELGETMIGQSVEDITKRITKKKKTYTFSSKVNVALDFVPEGDKLVSSNVVGYLEGTDKKDELLVITAHYDHLGTNGELVFNGADDDGSGTVGVMPQPPSRHVQ